MKIVLDSNVFLSGLASPDSVPGKILSAWDNHSFDIVTSDFQLAEMARVMNYPKVKKLLKWDEFQVQEFIKQLCLRVEIIDISAVEAQVPTDSDDTPILATLIASKADFLISGDKDLLSLQNEYNIESPAAFVTRL